MSHFHFGHLFIDQDHIRALNIEDTGVMRVLISKTLLCAMIFSSFASLTCAAEQSIEDLQAKIKNLEAQLAAQKNQNSVEKVKAAVSTERERLKKELLDASKATKDAEKAEEINRGKLKEAFEKAKDIFKNEVTEEQAKKLDLVDAQKQLDTYIADNKTLDKAKKKLLADLQDALKNTIETEQSLTAKKAAEAKAQTALDELTKEIKAIDDTQKDSDPTLSAPESTSDQNELAALNKKIVDLYNSHKDVIQLDAQNDKKTIPFLIKLYTDFLDSSKGIDDKQKISKLSDDLIKQRDAFFKEISKPSIKIKIAGKPNVVDSNFARNDAVKKWNLIFKAIDDDVAAIQQQGDIQQTRLAYDAVRNGLIDRQKYEAARNLNQGATGGSRASSVSTQMIIQSNSLFPDGLPDVNNAHSLKRALKYRRKALHYRSKLQRLPQN